MEECHGQVCLFLELGPSSRSSSDALRFRAGVSSPWAALSSGREKADCDWRLEAGSALLLRGLGLLSSEGGVSPAGGC